jgi:hypothetical protein
LGNGFLAPKNGGNGVRLLSQELFSVSLSFSTNDGVNFFLTDLNLEIVGDSLKDELELERGFGLLFKALLNLFLSRPRTSKILLKGEARLTNIVNELC